jgi:hypothetical protein
MKRWTLRILAAATSLVSCLSIAEGVIRLGVGRSRAPAPAALRIRVDPPGSRMYQPDARLGYTLVPDQHIAVTLDPLGRFVSTTTTAGHRVTSPPRAGHMHRRPQIWIFGCSFTFGWGVDDEDSYPWKLQELMPDYEIVNFGTGGYSTLQSLIQFEGEIQRAEIPEIAVLAYLNFHEQRNTMSPLRSKSLGFMWRNWGEADQPYAVMNSDGQLQRRKSEPYRPFLPFVRYSALANFLDWQVVAHLENEAKKSDRRKDVTRALVRQFIQVGSDHGVTVLIADLDAMPSDIGSVATSEGTQSRHIGVPYYQPGMTLPDAIHPTAKAHGLLAERMRTFLAP